MRSVDVLPQPDGPQQATIAARRDLEVDRINRLCCRIAWSVDQFERRRSPSFASTRMAYSDPGYFRASSGLSRDANRYAKKGGNPARAVADRYIFSAVGTISWSRAPRGAPSARSRASSTRYGGEPQGQDIKSQNNPMQSRNGARLGALVLPESCRA